jgi:hypothetical protein
MKLPAAWMFSKIERGILCGASVVVPAELRAEWLREWRAELWHGREAISIDGESNWEIEKAMLHFCSGAIRDAFALRRLSMEKREAQSAFHDSAGECLLLLSAVFMVCFMLSRVIPGVRAESQARPYRVNSHLIMIQDAFASDDSLATISAEKYMSWKGRRQRYFDGFAFYRISKESVATGKSTSVRWQVARGSLNLFWILGLPIKQSAVAGDAVGTTPGLILSEKAWRSDFGSDPNVTERTVRIGQAEARVIGVAPAGAWRLPGDANAWLLGPDAANRGVGYVIAHLTELGSSEMNTNRVEITTLNSDESNEELCGISLSHRTRGPWDFYRFALFLAILALPAITSVSFGESNFCSYRPSWANRACRWMFLCAKIALLLPTIYFASLDLAYWNTTNYSIGAQYIQLISAFTLGLFGLRWILLDQKNRCPVCLRRVTHPAQVGLAGRTFLAWNGTELMCAGGHTLLHVPGLPTSWFSTQRWLYLDTSWRFLFAGSSGT